MFILKKKKTSAEKVLTSVVYRIQSKKLRCGSHACLLSASEWCDVWLYAVGQRNSACRSVCTEPRLEETTFVIRLQETETPTVPAPVRLWVEGSRWGHFILEIPLTFFLDCFKKKKKKTSANSLTHTGMRAVLILACKQQCANKADVIAPAQVSSYC